MAFMIVRASVGPGLQLQVKIPQLMDPEPVFLVFVVIEGFQLVDGQLVELIKIATTSTPSPGCSLWTAP